MPSEIVVEDVTKVFATRGEPTLALDKLRLTLPAGQVTCLLGPSGCGKSTILNIIAAFDVPTTGRVLVDGNAVRNISPERAVVFQQPTLFPWLTVMDNVLAPAKAQASARDTSRRRATEILTHLGLDAFTKSFTYELSGGMRQRVQIARALLCRPSILLMDEPFGALDAQTRLELQQMFVELCASEHPTALFVTHDIDEAILVANQVVVMSARPGRVREIVEVSLPEPRGYHSLTENSFVSTKQHLLEVVYGDKAALA